MKFSTERNEVFQAFTTAWAQVKTLKEGTTVKIPNKKDPSKSYEYTFTELSDMYEVLTEILGAVEIGVMHDTYTEINEDTGRERNYCNTMLIHSSGQYIESGYLNYDSLRARAYDAGGNQIDIADMKGNGGQFSYMKRISLMATMGISTKKADAEDHAGEKNKQIITSDPKKKERFGRKDDRFTESGTAAGDEFLEGSEEVVKPTGKILTPIQALARLEFLFSEVSKKQGGTPEQVWEKVQELIPRLHGEPYKNMSRDSSAKVIGMLERVLNEGYNIYTGVKEDPKSPAKPSAKSAAAK